MIKKIYDNYFYKSHIDKDYTINFLNSLKKFNLNTTICLCKSRDDKQILNFDRCKNKFEIVICKRCGLIRSKYYFSTKDILDIYKSSYRDERLKIQKNSKSLYNALSESEYIKENWNIIEEYVNLSGSRKLNIVDIGAGGGGFLHKYKNIHNCYAADYNLKWLEHANKNNIKIIYGGIKEVLDTKKRYDLIILNHVVEHWSDFETEIINLKKLCTLYKTKIFIEVPGIDSLKNGRREGDFRGDVVFYHYHYFASYTLVSLFEKYGFECLYSDSKARIIVQLPYQTLVNKKKNFYKKIINDIEISLHKKIYFVFKNLLIRKFTIINLTQLKYKLYKFLNNFTLINIIKKIYNFFTLPNYYLVSNNFKKIVHLHTPQCGGNSINYFLKLNFGFRLEQFRRNSVFFFDKYINSKYFIITSHTGINFVRDFFKNENIFIIFSIRNPKNRLLSNYYRNRKLFLNESPDSKFMSLEEFLNLRINTKIDNIFIRYLLNEITYDGCVDNEFINQNDFDNAIKKLKFINYINIIDQPDCFLKMQKALGIKFPISNFFKLQKNKVSDSKYPPITDKEEILLQKLTYYDQKLYNLVKQNKDYNI